MESPLHFKGQIHIPAITHGSIVATAFKLQGSLRAYCLHRLPLFAKYQHQIAVIFTPIDYRRVSNNMENSTSSWSDAHMPTARKSNVYLDSGVVPQHPYRYNTG